MALAVPARLHVRWVKVLVTPFVHGALCVLRPACPIRRSPWGPVWGAWLEVGSSADTGREA